MELVYIAGQLSQATRPEDVFGNLGDASDALFTLRRIYHAMAKIAHPDMYLVPQEKAGANSLRPVNAMVQPGRAKNQGWKIREEGKDPFTYGKA